MSGDLVTLLADLEEEEAIALVRERLEAGEAAAAILEDCQAGLGVVGERYREGTYYIAGLIMAGEIFREVMEILEPLLAPGTGGGAVRGDAPATRGRFLVCTVQGDIHDLGKNLLVMLLRSANIEVVDLGVDVPADDVVRAAHDVAPDVIGLSGLLLTSFPTMRSTIAALRAALGDGPAAPRVIVGGGQMTADTAGWIGADRWSDNAGAAVPEIVEMVATARAAR
jgi:methanogenic corrinoid protein MtbC1